MCPVCGNKTRLKIREDTELKKFPLYCPKCRHLIAFLINFLTCLLGTRKITTKIFKRGYLLSVRLKVTSLSIAHK
ncbi:cysteine-rich KTR domain-containing protein [Ligilactobacillus salivarius]|uniref:cysteine-rich KTR domain-containing protein n=1 Tax=Ligilactobacillus salivarius TaxID=1624 RepID=UPI0036607367